MKLWDIEVVADLKGVDKKYLPLFQAALKDWQIVVESSEFVDALEAEIAKYKKRLDGELSKWKTASVDDIVKRLLSIEGTKGKMVFKIFTYYTAKRVIGYGVGSNDNTYVNTKYLSAYTVSDKTDLRAVGSNLTHEKGHDRGFDHDYEKTTRRPNSICYILNDAYEVAYTKLIINKKPDVVVVPKPATDATPVPQEPVTETPIDPTGPVVTLPSTPEKPKRKVCIRPWYYLGLVTVCHYED